MAILQDERPQSRSNRQLILAAQIAFLPTGILTTLLGPMLPILIARWGLSDQQAGNLFLVQFLASLAGVQISKCGPKPHPREQDARYHSQPRRSEVERGHPTSHQQQSGKPCMGWAWVSSFPPVDGGRDFESHGQLAYRSRSAVGSDVDPVPHPP